MTTIIKLDTLVSEKTGMPFELYDIEGQRRFSFKTVKDMLDSNDTRLIVEQYVTSCHDGFISSEVFRYCMAARSAKQFSMFNQKLSDAITKSAQEALRNITIDTEQLHQRFCTSPTHDDMLHRNFPPIEQTFTATQIRTKLEELCPSILDRTVDNPFLYNDVKHWHAELSEARTKILFGEK